MNTTDDTPAPTGTPTLNAVREELLKNTKRAQEARERLAVEEEEAKLPPVLALGRRGREYAYYSRTYKQEFSLKAGEHTKMNLLALAPMDELVAWLFPDRGEKDAPTTRELVDVMARHLLDISGRASAYGMDTLRGAGCWLTDEGIIYNAGDACYLCPPDGTPRRCSNIRMAGNKLTIYDTRDGLPHPAADALTDDEGEALHNFFAARAWRQWYAPDIMTGWTATAILGQAATMRLHAWITAPTNTGKSQTVDSYRVVLGSNPLTGKGGFIQTPAGNSTEAGIRLALQGGTLPLMLDEAEADEDEGEKDAVTLKRIVKLARLATTGGKIQKAPNNVLQEYSLYSSFLLFSIYDVLTKAQDLNRFARLDLRPLQAGKELQELDARFAAAYAAVTTPGYTNKLITRVLQNAYRMRQLTEELTAHLKAKNIQDRTARYAACAMAGQWVLTHSGAMTDAYRDRAVEVARALANDAQGERDEDGALDVLLRFTPTKNVGLTVAQLARSAKTAEGGDAALQLESIGAAVKLGKDGEYYLRVEQPAIKRKQVYKGTVWQSGRDGVGKTLARLDGVIFKQTAIGMRRVDCIWIPERYWTLEE